MKNPLLYGFFSGFISGTSFSYLCTKAYIYEKNIVIPKDSWLLLLEKNKKDNK